LFDFVDGPTFSRICLLSRFHSRGEGSVSGTRGNGRR
jgi:hypothetical protein